MKIKANGYYNDPNIARAASNLSSLFAPPSARDEALFAHAAAKRAEAAGIAALGWHDARRTLAGNLLDAGVDLALVQRVLGHASPATTAAYDRRPEDARRKAQRKVTVPYLSGH